MLNYSACVTNRPGGQKKNTMIAAWIFTALSTGGCYSLPPITSEPLTRDIYTNMCLATIGRSQHETKTDALQLPTASGVISDRLGPVGRPTMA